MTAIRNLPLREDERWWLRGFLIVAVLFVAMVVSASLGTGNTAYNATSGVLISLFVGCGAFLGALFVDRAAAALNVFNDDGLDASRDAGAESLRQLLQISSDLDRQIEQYLRRVHREFSAEPAAVATPAVRSAPQAVEMREPAGITPPQQTRTATPKSLAEWTPPTPPPTNLPPSGSGKSSKRDRRDWAA